MAMVASSLLKWQTHSHLPYISDAHTNVESDKILAPAEFVEQKKTPRANKLMNIWTLFQNPLENNVRTKSNSQGNT